MILQEQIDKARGEIRTDEYSMSIGEWISLYESREIDIHPEFQRFFRWTPAQKTRLIESILLGIPIPQIFVAQRNDGIWDVVDGLQRLSTIYQLAGILRDENDAPVQRLVLESTKLLPNLGGKKWEDDDDLHNAFTSAQRLLVKRSKIGVSIILRESDETSKYELFQRLNTGGSPLSEQEVRNVILIMIDRDVYKWLRALSQDESFKECTSLSDRALEEQYDMDLVLRFLVLRNIPAERLRKIGDINDFLTSEMIRLAENKLIDFQEEEEMFRSTFSILRDQLGGDSMHKFDAKKNKFTGGFLISAFEVVAMGLGYNYKKPTIQNVDLVKTIREIWSNSDFTSTSGSGIRASTRIPNTIPLGRRIFAS